MLLHVNYNELTGDFDGNLRDINVTVKHADIKLIGLQFDGSAADGKVTVRQQLQNVSIRNTCFENPLMEIVGVNSDMTYEGKNYYVSNAVVSAEKMIVRDEDKLSQATLSDLSATKSSSVENDLLDNRVKMFVNSVNADSGDQAVALDSLIAEFGISTINLEKSVEFKLFC